MMFCLIKNLAWMFAKRCFFQKVFFFTFTLGDSPSNRDGPSPLCWRSTRAGVAAFAFRTYVFGCFWFNCDLKSETGKGKIRKINMGPSLLTCCDCCGGTTGKHLEAIVNTCYWCMQQAA